MSRRIAVVALLAILLGVFLLSLRDCTPSSDAPAPPATEGEAMVVPPLREGPEPLETNGDPEKADAEPESAAEDESPAKGRSLTGRVVRLDGTPVAGAVVALSTRYTDLFREGVRPYFSIDRKAARVRTGEDGTFRFDADTPHRVQCSGWQDRMQVRAEADGDASYFVELAGHMEKLALPDLVLRPAIEGRGIVEDAQGNPVANAKVSLRFVYGVGRSGEGGEQYLTVADRSDGSGRVRFCPIPRREDWDVDVEVEHPRYLAIDREIPIAEVDSDREFRIVVSTGLIVTGTLLQADGSPAGGYDIHVGRHGTNLRLMAVAKTKPDGTFEVRGVPPTGGAVGFEKGWNNLRHKVAVPSGEEGATVDLGEVRLAGGVTVRGVVHDENGKPVRCYVNMHNSKSYSGYLNPKWDKDKPVFTFEKVPPGTYVIEARKDLGNGDEIRGKVTGVKPGDGGVVVRLSRANSLLFVFHRAEVPDEPFEIRSPEIRFDYGSWSGGGKMTRKRIYLPPTGREYRFTITVAGFAEVRLEPIRPRPDREVVVDIYLVRD